MADSNHKMIAWIIRVKLSCLKGIQVSLPANSFLFFFGMVRQSCIVGKATWLLVIKLSLFLRGSIF